MIKQNFLLDLSSKDKDEIKYCLEAVLVAKYKLAKKGVRLKAKRKDCKKKPHCL